MNRRKYIIALMATLVLSACGESYLEVKPQGTIEQAQLLTAKNGDALVTAAYAALGDPSYGPIQDTWYSAMRSGDNYKGGAGTADFGGNYPMEMFSILNADYATANNVWIAVYNSISRANKALVVLQQLTDAEMPTRKTRIAEARFLRAHWHFSIKRLFKYPVFIDETMTVSDIKSRSNREFTNDQLWDKIAEDFKFAYDNLPTTQPEIGRANKYAAATYLAKTRLYQAYEQDENNNVININATKLQEAVTMLDVVINSGKYSLFDNFGKNFTYGYDNGVESIFSIQFSINDGTASGKVDVFHTGDYNMAPGYGCCWANVPTQNVVNAFKTDAAGLPLFDTYNNSDMSLPAQFKTNNVDPRLDHTVGIPTHPFKYDQTFIYDYSWARTPAVYGNYSAMRQIQLPTSPSFKRLGGFFGSSKNTDILRYDDVLLMKAEAVIELNQLDLGRSLINQVRARAGNAATRSWVTWTSGPNAGQGFSNYVINTYNTPFPDKDYARKALQFERRLEFATESSRFYDLVRWGIAAETINAYFAVEKTKRSYLNAAKFTKGRDEYLPIPNAQITLSEGVYKQNSGAW